MFPTSYPSNSQQSTYNQVTRDTTYSKKDECHSDRSSNRTPASFNSIEKILIKREREDHKKIINLVCTSMLSSALPTNEADITNYKIALEKALEGKFYPDELSPPLEKMLVNVYYWVNHPECLIANNVKATDKEKKEKFDDTKVAVSEAIKARISLLENLNENVKTHLITMGNDTLNQKISKFPYSTLAPSSRVSLSVSTLFLAQKLEMQNFKKQFINQALLSMR